ncbi:MAG: hypothetical protein R2710_15725 [Acidimicrobiales bacterium]
MGRTDLGLPHSSRSALVAAAKNDIAGAAVRARLDAMRLDALMVRHPVAVPDGSTAKQFLDGATPNRSALPTPSSAGATNRSAT